MVEQAIDSRGPRRASNPSIVVPVAFVLTGFQTLRPGCNAELAARPP